MKKYRLKLKQVNSYNFHKILSRFKFLSATIIVVLLSTSCNSCNQEADTISPDITPDQEKEYVLVWSDEFDIDGRPNPENWTFEEGFVRNQELQWYQEENAFVENGLLIIEGRRDTFPNPLFEINTGDWKKRREYVNYTSSSLKTQGLQSWRYGRFEIKAKIKTEPGLWPAIWTLGDGHEWPQGGEIDIMEFYDNKILANAAWAGANRWQAIWDSYRLPVSELGPDWSNNFHIWRMDWTHDFIKLYLDDKLLNTIGLGKTFNKRGTINNPFRETQHFILLNLAIGGTNGGDPSFTSFPSRYEIDYVRVSQLQ